MLGVRAKVSAWVLHLDAQEFNVTPVECNIMVMAMHRRLVDSIQLPVEMKSKGVYACSTIACNQKMDSDAMLGSPSVSCRAIAS